MTAPITAMSARFAPNSVVHSPMIRARPVCASKKACPKRLWPPCRSMPVQTFPISVASRQEKIDSQRRHREAPNRIPQRTGSAIVRKRYDGVVPKRPDSTADQRDARERSDIRQLRDKKSAPAKLFAQRGNT